MAARRENSKDGHRSGGWAGYQPEKEGDFLIKAGLKLSHLRLILAIADSGQVSAAAEALNISQPAASRMLHEVESLLKAPLCQRAARGVEMTRFGEAMAKRARSILLEIREASREITELKTGYGGSVHLGSVTGPAITLAVPAIRRVRAMYPAIQINCHVEASNVLARELLSARYDFVIGRLPDEFNPRDFEARPLGFEHSCLIVRKDHPLLAIDRPGLAELREYGWVFQPHGALLRRSIERLFIDSNVQLPDNIVSTPSVLFTMAMVVNSDAVAPISREVAEFVAVTAGAAGGIAVLDTAFEIGLEPYSLITARGRGLPPSARLLHDLIVEENGRDQLQGL
ncbi:MAG: LysR family transcriptional regulator [Rhizobiaceae bacterium]|nr:LysR family transcriptional regulator [Rhizobiaceae bacterium]